MMARFTQTLEETAAQIERLAELPERFRVKVSVDMFSGCWVWTAGVTDRGYGTFWADGKSYKAHRYSFGQLRGPIPPMAVLDHLLTDRPVDPGPCTHGEACTNPWHTEPVTVEVNAKRVRPWNSDKTHCPRGHAYDDFVDPATGEKVPGAMVVYVGRDGYARRYCSACRQGRDAGSLAGKEAL